MTYWHRRRNLHRSGETDNPRPNLRAGSNKRPSNVLLQSSKKADYTGKELPVQERAKSGHGMAIRDMSLI